MFEYYKNIESRISEQYKGYDPVKTHKTKIMDSKEFKNLQELEKRHLFLKEAQVSDKICKAFDIDEKTSPKPRLNLKNLKEICL